MQESISGSASPIPGGRGFKSTRRNTLSLFGSAVQNVTLVFRHVPRCAKEQAGNYLRNLLLVTEPFRETESSVLVRKVIGGKMRAGRSAQAAVLRFSCPP